MNAHREVIDLILTAGDRLPSPDAPRVLDRLFEELRADPPPRPVAETERMIWSVWTGHEDATAVDAMGRALRMMTAQSFEVAERVLDGLVRDFPTWAEPWNKRATLYFMMDRDGESTGDIVETLRLEPRHFGALSGFGQICLRRGDEAGALIAFEEVVRLHPGLDNISEAADALNQKLGSSIN